MSVSFRTPFQTARNLTWPCAPPLESAFQVAEDRPVPAGSLGLRASGDPPSRVLGLRGSSRRPRRPGSARGRRSAGSRAGAALPLVRSGPRGRGRRAPRGSGSAGGAGDSRARSDALRGPRSPSRAAPRPRAPARGRGLEALPSAESPWSGAERAAVQSSSKFGRSHTRDRLLYTPRTVGGKRPIIHYIKETH